MGKFWISPRGSILMVKRYEATKDEYEALKDEYEAQGVRREAMRNGFIKGRLNGG